MANYINLTLDTTAPSGLTAIINNGATHTSATAATLAISCNDENTAGYQMKIWGTATAATEEQATWESFTATKNITLPTGDGAKRVYVKIRDDVWNESIAVSDTIQLKTTLPEVRLENVTVSKLSEIAGKNVTTFRATVSGDINAVTAFKIAVVENVNSTVNDATNKFINFTNGTTANGSKVVDTINTSNPIDLDNCMIVVGDYVDITLYAADISSVSPGDGVKIIKVFAKDEIGIWSA